MNRARAAAPPRAPVAADPGDMAAGSGRDGGNKKAGRVPLPCPLLRLNNTLNLDGPPASWVADILGDRTPAGGAVAVTGGTPSLCGQPVGMSNPKVPRDGCCQRTVFARCMRVRGVLLPVVVVRDRQRSAARCGCASLVVGSWGRGVAGSWGRGAMRCGHWSADISRAARSLAGGFLPGPAGRGARAGPCRCRGSADRAWERSERAFGRCLFRASGHVSKTMQRDDCHFVVRVRAPPVSAPPVGRPDGRGMSATSSTDARRRGPSCEGPRRRCSIAGDRGGYMRSKMPAAPMPPPMHMLTIP